MIRLCDNSWKTEGERFFSESLRCCLQIYGIHFIPCDFCLVLLDFTVRDFALCGFNRGMEWNFVGVLYERVGEM